MDGGLPLGFGPLEEGMRILLETSEDYQWENCGKTENVVQEKDMLGRFIGEKGL